MNNFKYQHYVFNTYKSRSVLIDPMAINFLYDSFAEIAKAKGFDYINNQIDQSGFDKRYKLVKIGKGTDSFTVGPNE